MVVLVLAGRASDRWWLHPPPDGWRCSRGAEGLPQLLPLLRCEWRDDNLPHPRTTIDNLVVLPKRRRGRAVGRCAARFLRRIGGDGDGAVVVTHCRLQSQLALVARTGVVERPGDFPSSLRGVSEREANAERWDL